MNNEKRKAYTIIGVLAVLTIFVVALSVFNFHNNLADKEYEMQKEINRDFAEQESNIVEAELYSYLSSLYCIAEFMTHDELNTVDHLEHLENVMEHQGFKRLSLITPDGKLISKNNPEVDISDRSYYSEVMQGKSVITGLKDSRITGNRIFIVAVPVFDLEGNVTGGVHGAVNVDDFQKSEAENLELSTTSSYVIDRDGTYILRSESNESSWNYENIFDRITVDDQNITAEQLREQIKEGKSVTVEIMSGNEKYLTVFSPIAINDWYTVVAMPWSEIEEHIDLLLDTDIYLFMFTVMGMVALLCFAIIFHIQTERKLERSKEAELRQRLFSGVIGFIEGDIDEDKILHCTRELYLSNEENIPLSLLFEKHIAHEVHEDYQEIVARDLSIDGIRENYAKGITKKTVEYPIYNKSGNIEWMEYEINIDEDEENGHLLIYNIIRNIDEKKNKEMRLKFKAERDAMTGLYNRSTAIDLVNQFLIQDSDENNTHAFVIIDLDNFKKLNDTLGHKMGDRALMEVASTLTGYFRRDDVVCRLGGDEFIVFIKYISYKNVVSKMAPLMDYLHINYESDGKTVSIGASAGIAMVPQHGKEFNELYKCADQALYRAKKEGKSTFRCYSSE